jgi:hypothetical protein
VREAYIKTDERPRGEGARDKKRHYMKQGHVANIAASVIAICELKFLISFNDLTNVRRVFYYIRSL